MSSEAPSFPLPRMLVRGLLLLAIGLKVGLLLSSQSMADGDEAVTGLMAQHVVEDGIHPIYPWGVTYGAGASVEIHLAATLFALFGPSDVALKSAGLLIWIGSLALVFLVGRRLGGPGVGRAAALLYGFAPQAAEWSLKVSGGHGVAVALSLLALWLAERNRQPWLAAAVLPVAAFAHPIVLPFAAVVAAYLLYRARGLDRAWTLAGLAASCATAVFLLWPAGNGVWDPSTRGFDALGLLGSLPTLALTLFTPNLHARVLPGLLPLSVSLLWLGALAATWRGGARGRVLLYALAPAGVLLTVQPVELAARHLLLFYPLACLVLGLGLLGGMRFGKEILLILLGTGFIMQVATMASPVVHGAAPQDLGIDRANVRAVISELESRGIANVYCSDPMFQWNITWGSRERIVARWLDPVDRYPDYPARVDAARLAGSPVGMVRATATGGDGKGPRIFEAGPLRDSPRFEDLFPRSPRLR